MLPYFKVSEVRTLMDADVQGYGGAMDLVMRESGVDPAGRNILVAHQFFAGSGLPQTSESEEQRPGASNASPSTASPRSTTWRWATSTSPSAWAGIRSDTPDPR